MATQVSQLKESPDLRKALADAQADIADLRAKFVVLAAKLDLDAGVTDTNYGTLTAPASQQFQA